MSQSITFPKHHFWTSCHQRANVEHISLWGTFWIQNIKTPFQGHPSSLFLVSKPCIDSHHLTRCLCPQVFTLSLQGCGNNAVVRVTLVFGVALMALCCLQGESSDPLHDLCFLHRCSPEAEAFHTSLLFPLPSLSAWVLSHHRVFVYVLSGKKASRTVILIQPSSLCLLIFFVESLISFLILSPFYSCLAQYITENAIFFLFTVVSSVFRQCLSYRRHLLNLLHR